jgi:hypothetical protein
MLKFQVQSYSMPRWIVPLLALAALALIPFALVLALGLGLLAVGASAFRAFLLPGGRSVDTRFEVGRPSKLNPGSSNTIDADYEIKGEDEKNEPS